MRCREAVVITLTVNTIGIQSSVINLCLGMKNMFLAFMHDKHVSFLCLKSFLIGQIQMNADRIWQSFCITVTEKTLPNLMIYSSIFD